jgi:adenylate cyclase
MTATRRLAAILAADVAGYSRLMGADEEGTLERLKALRRELADPKIAEHHGRIVKTTGDGLLVEFASVVDAVRCAVEVQQAMPERDTGVAAENRIELRIGINLGDVIVDEDDIYGDGVNIAARVEALADAGGVFVSNTVYDQVRDRSPFLFEDLGEQQVKNIARPVRVYRVRDAATATSNPPAPVPPLPDKPSIAVLPFVNMSGDPEQEYFVDGMVEEIITALSRIRWLFVIARKFELHLQGPSRRCEAGRARIGCPVRARRLGAQGRWSRPHHCAADRYDYRNPFWADRFDGSLEDVFELQDKVASSVAGVIEPALQAAETARSASRPTNDLTAYDFYLRAYAMTVLSTRQVPEALRLMEQAIGRDPRYGLALALAAYCCYRLVQDGRSEDPVVDRLKGVDFARRALEVSGDDPGVLANAAYALAYFGEDIGVMMALVDRALVLNPNYARGWHMSGGLRLRAGQLDIAIEHAEAALRLSPRARVGPTLATIGAAHFYARRFDEAVPKFLLAIQEDPTHPTPYRQLAACYAHMGRLDDAREIVERLRAITPVVMTDARQVRNPEYRELFLSGLHLAAGETR